MSKYKSWVAAAEDAEAIGDWYEAKECWYRAAESLNGNPNNLRAKYNQREDAAGIKCQMK